MLQATRPDNTGTTTGPNSATAPRPVGPRRHRTVLRVVGIRRPALSDGLDATILPRIRYLRACRSDRARRLHGGSRAGGLARRAVPAAHFTADLRVRIAGIHDRRRRDCRPFPVVGGRQADDCRHRRECGASRQPRRMADHLLRVYGLHRPCCANGLHGSDAPPADAARRCRTRAHRPARGLALRHQYAGRSRRCPVCRVPVTSSARPHWHGLRRCVSSM